MIEFERGLLYLRGALELVGGLIFEREKNWLMRRGKYHTKHFVRYHTIQSMFGEYWTGETQTVRTCEQKRKRKKSHGEWHRAQLFARGKGALPITGQPPATAPRRWNFPRVLGGGGAWAHWLPCNGGNNPFLEKNVSVEN